MNKITTIDWHNPQSRLLFAGCLCLILGLWCWWGGRNLQSRQGYYHTLSKEVLQMNNDVARIKTLREAPRLATEREKPNEQLLDQVRQAMEDSEISRDLWSDNFPTQLMRIPKSDYMRLGVNLSFTRLSMQNLVSLVFHLTQGDPSLSVPKLKLTASQQQSHKVWDVNLILSYLIYSPRSEGDGEK